MAIRIIKESDNEPRDFVNKLTKMYVGKTYTPRQFIDDIEDYGFEVSAYDADGFETTYNDEGFFFYVKRNKSGSTKDVTISRIEHIK